MSKSKCKICGEIRKDLLPLNGEFLGQNLLKIINDVIQSEISVDEIGKSVVCNMCAGAVFLVNTKIIEYKRVFQPQKKVQSVPQTAKSPKKGPSNAKAELVKETKEQQHKQSDGDIKPYLKPKVNTSVTAKTATATSPATQNVVATENISQKSETRSKKESISQNDVPMNNITLSSPTSSESEEEHKETTKLPSENKPAPIRTRRQTVYSFECEFCCFQSGVIKAFQNHMTEIHNQKMPRIFKCSLCDSRYVAKAGLDKHVIKCLQYRSADKPTNNDNQDDNPTTNTQKTPSNGVATPSAEEDLDQSDSEETKDSIIYENSPLSSTKLKQQKKVRDNSPSNESDEDEEGATGNYFDIKDENNKTVLDFPMEIARICPVAKQSLSPSKSNLLLNEPSKKRSLSTKDESRPSKKTRLSSNGDTSQAKETTSHKESISSEIISKKEAEPIKKPTLSKREISTFQFVCTHCKEIVVGVNTFKKHLSKVHNDTDNHIFTCEYCPKKYLAFKSLTTHLAKNHATSKKEENVQTESIAVINNSEKNIKKQSSKDNLNNTSVKKVLPNEEEHQNPNETPKRRKRKNDVSVSQADTSVESPVKVTSNISVLNVTRNKKHLVSFDLKEKEELPEEQSVTAVQCESCFKYFKNTTKLERHKRKGDCTANENDTVNESSTANDSKKPNIFHCDTCGKAFYEEPFLKTHIKKKHVSA